MSFSSEQASLVRTPVVLVKLRLDYCQNTFGQSPCAAAGTPCYYTYFTCKDKANYARGSKDYRFCAQEGTLPAEALPYLARMVAVPTEIKADQHLTRVGEISFDFDDDFPLPLANPDKAVGNPEAGGTFWRNLLARNPNYRGRPVEVWAGFQGLPESEARLIFRGLLTNIAVAEGRATITVQDYLKKLEVKIPAAQSSENVLTAAYSGGTDLRVTNASEFASASPGQPGLVMIEDQTNGSEYISYTGRSAGDNKLTGCQAGRFGTVSVSHPAGCRVSNAVVWAEDDGIEGLPLDQIVAELLTTYGGISALDVATVDLGATLGPALGSSESSLSCVGVDDFPAAGIVRLEDEVIGYSGKGTGMAFSAVDDEVGPQDAQHSLDQGSGVEQWHVVKFQTGAGDPALDCVRLKLMRNGFLAGAISLYLYSDQAGNPGAMLNFLGKKDIAQVSPGLFGDLTWSRHLSLTPSTTYWLGYKLRVTIGGASIFHALKASAIATEFKHARSDAGPFTAIAGLPLFAVEESAGAYDTLSGCRRGAYGSLAAAHAAGVSVELLEVSDEAGRWLASARYRRFLEKPVAIKDLLHDLRQSTLAHLWQGEDSRIHFKCAPVPFFRDPPPQLTDAEHLVRQSVSADRNEEARITRVTVYYDPLTADPGSDPEQYRAALLHLDQEVESENYYGEQRNCEIFSPWIYRSLEALNAAAHLLLRFRYGAPRLAFGLELKDADLQVGDFVRVTTDLIQSPAGVTRPNALYEVVKKKPAGANRFEYEALEAAGGGLNRYAAIAPASYTAVYDDYGVDDHAKYAWVSDADQQIGDNAEPGYCIS